MVEADGYILRIARKDWIEKVFDTAMYYTGAPRKWKAGQTILFIGRTESGDSFIGYGVIENVYEKEELSEEEQRECETYGWRKALEFKYIVRFEKPLLVRETFLRDLKLSGKTLHSLPLKAEQIKSILSQAEG
ncbi:hypothetical protein KEJ37_06515 [Candidatus Bathyarchaeota archaeon]|nr:hypothetical protein [Candidatus Bathyarchaeota archaeon]